MNETNFELNFVDSPHLYLIDSFTKTCENSQINQAKNLESIEFASDKFLFYVSDRASYSYINVDGFEWDLI
jgi:hypothetical protein